MKIPVTQVIPEVKQLQALIMDSDHSSSSHNGKKSMLSPSTAGNTSANDESTVTLPSGDAVKDRCRERLENFKKQIKKTMPLSDQLDMRDPQMIAEYAQEVYQSMLDKEDDYVVDFEYLQKI